MKKFFTMFVFVLLIPASQVFAAPVLKLGAVDLQRAVKECREGVAARTDLQRKIEKFNAELKVMQVDYQRMSSELEKDGGKLSDDRRAEKEAALQKKGRELQNRQREAQEEIKQMESDYLKKLVNRLGVVMAVAMIDNPGTAGGNLPASQLVPSTYMVPQLIKFDNGTISRVEGMVKWMPFGYTSAWAEAKK